MNEYKPKVMVANFINTSIWIDIPTSQLLKSMSTQQANFINP